MFRTGSLCGKLVLPENMPQNTIEDALPGQRMSPKRVKRFWDKDMPENKQSISDDLSYTGNAPRLRPMYFDSFGIVVLRLEHCIKRWPYPNRALREER
jgi:hypothetical protein